MAWSLKLRILVLTSAERALNNRKLWTALADHGELELRFLEKNQQRRLSGYFSSINVSRYDRIVLDLMFKHIYTQGRFLRKIPVLTLYEEDAYLDFMPGSRWYGAFSAFYKKIPRLRVISTGHMVTQHLRRAGVDAHFIPKGFDPAHLHQMKLARDIEIGFVGRLGSKTYTARKELLEALARQEPIKILRTHSADEYVRTLNRIRIFISADIGLNEYMAKNFEAMACGCLLLAKRQGNGEEEALGLVDGVNVLLYDSLASLLARVAWVRSHPELADAIARKGLEYVLAHHSYEQLADKVAAVIEPPFNVEDVQPWWKFW